MEPYDLVSAELRGHVARPTKEEAERGAVLGRSRAAEPAKTQARALAWGVLPCETDAEIKGKGKKGRDKGGGKGKDAGLPAAAGEA